MEATHHRAGKLKQQNKAHKSRATSKRVSKKFLTVASSAGSRARSASQQSTASSNGSSNRAERKQKAADIRKQKRNDVIMRKRMGGGFTAPRAVCIVSLSETIGEPLENYSRSVASRATQHNKIEETHNFPDKSRITYINTSVERDPVKTLDACKVADIVVFVVAIRPGDDQEEIEIKSSVSGGLAMLLSSCIDERGREMITLIKAQGLPTAVGVIEGLERIPAKHRTAVKRNLTTFFQTELNSGHEMKVLEMKSEQEAYLDSAKALVRSLTEVSLKPITWRSERSYLLGVEKVLSKDSTQVVGIKGHLRGRPMSANQLVHVCGQGTFRLLKILFPVDPTSPASHLERIELEPVVPDPTKQPSLKEEADPDPLMGEQTWPLQEELDAADDEKYGNENEDNADEMDVEDDAKSKSSKKTDLDPGKEYLKAWGVDVEEEDEFDWGGAPLNKPPKSKEDRAKLDLEFPDEMDTPGEIPARERFAKYRGLKSFRTSPWHPTESLPREYAYIHQLRNYKQAQKLVLSQSEEIEKDWLTTQTLPEGYVEPGFYVELIFEGGFAHSDWQDPLVVGALLPHEHRLSLLNCLIQPKGANSPVESRDELELHVGFWRRTIRPVFSEHNLNSDKHKMERFMEPGRWTVCSSYAPITFGTNVPSLLFKPMTGELVGVGSVLNVDPSRIVLKKVVLTGLPFRIKKRWAVVRKMFYTPEDVAWFQPVELYTKYGASGRILESVGTHGSMKCLFDRIINQRDTICMALYKRVFPKRTMGMFPALQDEDESDLSERENKHDLNEE